MENIFNSTRAYSVEISPPTGRRFYVASFSVHRQRKGLRAAVVKVKLMLAREIKEKFENWSKGSYLLLIRL